ncbi:MAG: HAD family hydrolase [Candidatus Omnitrophica bacterium]|nr:HAD family hydrolase [Candidatus Omnitrophota bacterium]
MGKQLVIFDADGTLADTNHQFVEAYQEAFRRMGREVSADLLLATVGMGHDQAVPLVTSAEWYKDHGAELIEIAEKIYLAEYLKKSRLFSGALEIVSALKMKGKSVALASSSQRVIIDHYLTFFPGGKDAFAAIVTFDDVTHSKPHPELFQKILDKLRMSPFETCAVGDSTWDMRAAERASIDAIAVLSGGTPEEELKKYGAKEIYKDVKHLLRLLNRSLIIT